MPKALKNGEVLRVGSWAVAPDHPARIAAVAARKRCSRSKLVREAIETMLRRHEAEWVQGFEDRVATTP
jgi:hypothetical protein